MDKETKKLFFNPVGMKVREIQAEDGTAAESRVIEGCAIVFNQETVLYEGKFCKVREVIEPSCITEEFLADQDIKLNLLHERDASVARNNKGVGTLNLEIREDGLYFSAEMPRCDLGDRALELVRNQTYTGCSFEFYPGEYTEETTTGADGREDTLISHKKFDSVLALTIGMDPAYPQTSVNLAREMRERDERIEAEMQKREDEEADRLAKEAAEEQERRQRTLRLQAMELELQRLRHEFGN